MSKIAAGGKIDCHKKDGVIGAVIKYQDKNCILTSYHILRAGKCVLGDIVHLDGHKGRIIEILWDHDLGIIETNAPPSEIEFSQIGKAEIGPAYSLNGTKRTSCNIMTVGETYHYLSFPFISIPLPGDSGSPIIQNERVVGVLASIFYSNATGIAIAIEKFRI